LAEIKVSEVQANSLRIVRKCRVVTYIMGTNEHGRDEVVAELSEEAANELLTTLAEEAK
jgi:hypothetical protein